MPHLPPAAYVIHIFAGVRKTARAIGVHPSTVSKWMAPKESKGCAGQVPSRNWHPIMEYARRHNLDITIDDLFGGRTIVF